MLAFEPRRSDLPLQVAFPILVANLTGELLGSSTAPTEAVEPGTPIVLNIPAGAIGLTVSRPDGVTSELVPGSTGAGSAVTYAATDVLGIYTVTPIVDPDASPAPSGGAGSGAPPSATPSGTPSAAPSGTPGAATPVPVDPLAPARFAVDLFDVNESTIAPGSAAAIEALGTADGPAPSPGTGGSDGGTAVERPTTRDELWLPIVLVVLVALCVEWALYHRDGLIRARRVLATRLGRDPGGST